MARKFPFLPLLLALLLLVTACSSEQTSEIPPHSSLLSNSLQIAQQPALTAPTAITSRAMQPTPTMPQTSTLPPAAPTNIPASGSGVAPYGPPPAMSAQEIQLTQQLFALINSNRAQLGLYPFLWNPTLAGGARLHSWNMVHCGFSHTCPNGQDQCQRIANEGFAGYTDCGENIGLAGPYPTPWGGVYNIQESMWNEPPTGWHRIHLTSTTLHRIGVGVFVDARGWIWFTEDMVS